MGGNAIGEFKKILRDSLEIILLQKYKTDASAAGEMALAAKEVGEC